MIQVEGVTKSYPTSTGRQYIFRDLSFSIPEKSNIALIGRNGSGKSTLMRLIGGIDVPDKGKITTNNTISWPVGLTGGFQGSLTGRQNVKFVGRIYGAGYHRLREIVRYVEDFAEIGQYFDEPVRTYSSGMRTRLAFALSLAFDFDYYLVDEVMSVGDAHFRKKATDAMLERIGQANLILVTHSMGQVRDLCDKVLLLQSGKVTIFSDVDAGISAYNQS